MKYTLITLAALSSVAFGQNLVTNGDFSDTSGMTSRPDPAGVFYEGIPNGWTTDSGRIIQVLTSVGGDNVPGFSSNFIDVYATDKPITLSQDVSGLTQGQQYRLSYDWGNRRNTSYDMTISMGGASASHIGTGFVAATNNTFTFTAGAATETLSIAFNHTNGDSYTGFNSTNFTVTQVVPEPSSTALLGLGGLALILRRRK